jgi:hypothetical protein
MVRSLLSGAVASGLLADTTVFAFTTGAPDGCTTAPRLSAVAVEGIVGVGSTA